MFLKIWTTLSSPTIVEIYVLLDKLSFVQQSKSCVYNLGRNLSQFPVSNLKWTFVVCKVQISVHIRQRTGCVVSEYFCIFLHTIWISWYLQTMAFSLHWRVVEEQESVTGSWINFSHNSNLDK